MMVRAPATSASGEIDDRASGAGRPTVTVVPPGGGGGEGGLEGTWVPCRLDDDRRLDVQLGDILGSVGRGRTQLCCLGELVGIRVDADHLTLPEG